MLASHGRTRGSQRSISRGAPISRVHPDLRQDARLLTSRHNRMERNSCVEASLPPRWSNRSGL